MFLLITLLLFSDAALQKKPSPVFASVHIGAHGPYRFLVDTGAETSLIAPDLAAELKLEPNYCVEVVSQHEVQTLPATKTDLLSVEGVSLHDMELVWHDLAGIRTRDRGVKGVLGLSALRNVAFTLNRSTRRLELSPSRPQGLVVPYRSVEGRLAVEATMGSDKLTLLLDSGSTHVVLFRTPAAMANIKPVKATYATVEGARAVVPTCWTAEMLVGQQIRIGTQPAAIVNRPGSQVDGLLPAELFASVYVDPGRGEMVITP